MPSICGFTPPPVFITIRLPRGHKSPLPRPAVTLISFSLVEFLRRTTRLHVNTLIKFRRSTPDRNAPQLKLLWGDATRDIIKK